MIATIYLIRTEDVSKHYQLKRPAMTNHLKAWASQGFLENPDHILIEVFYSDYVNSHRSIETTY